ncbi:unnamed protein product [Orchesella dallaii]|uniref:Ionotropic glutamate receptor C-terminal domain-containing protein n=1 Tax=Orchesella dallaii TaxID=48710 RepID=A0ABP1PSR5_9HEXA
MMNKHNFTITKNEKPVSLRIPKTLSSDTICTNVILILGSKLKQKDENILQNVFLYPPLCPAVVANQDKFILITRESHISYLNGSQFLRQLKYKLLLGRKVEDSIVHYEAHQFCYYCASNTLISLKTNKISSKHFPDFENNMLGSVLKVSSTDKLPGVFEIVTMENDKNVVKSGYHASALFHLMDGLNFTYDLYRSGGKGSTGHQLPNGTWIGTVGEVNIGKVDIGMACSMTFSRHFVVELIAPISFEYVNFATGPPKMIYTWKSLFWPFDALVWTTMGISTGITIIVVYFILKVPETWHQHETKISKKSKKWSIKTILQYFGRTWIEQGDDIPVELTQPVKIILGFWLLFAMVGTNAYRAKMVTLMTFPVMNPVPVTFDELAGSNYQIVFHYFGSVAYNTFKGSKSASYSAILGRMRKEPSPLKCLLSTISQSNIACILFGASYREVKNRNLSDSFGQSPILINPNTGFMFTPGIVAKRQAVFTPNFKRILSTSLQMGIHDYWERSNLKRFLQAKNEWLRNTNQSQLDYGIVRVKQEKSDGSVHLQHMKGAFVILVCGLANALCLFLQETTFKWIACCLDRNYLGLGVNQGHRSLLRAALDEEESAYLESRLEKERKTAAKLSLSIKSAPPPKQEEEKHARKVTFAERIRDFCLRADLFASAHTVPIHVICIGVAAVIIPVSAISIVWDLMATVVFEIPDLSTISTPAFVLFINFIAIPLAIYGYMMEYLMREYSQLASLGFVCVVVHPILFFVRALIEYLFSGYRGDAKIYFESFKRDGQEARYPIGIIRYSKGEPYSDSLEGMNVIKRIFGQYNG